VQLADLSAADAAAGVDISFDLGDGSPPLTNSEFAVADFSFGWLYNEAGTYTVTLTVTDKDGGTSVATKTFTIASTAVVTDDVNGGQMLLVAGGRASGPGGSNANTIDLRPKSGGVQVSVDGVVTDVLASVQRIVVYGDGGNDVITVSGSLPVAVEFYGGEGNDMLRGGVKDDILSGGAGHDLLVGGNGRDILLGGTGRDRLVGDSDEDILAGGTIAGEELWNEFGVDRGFLSFVRTEWINPTTSYATRVASLRESALIADVTVLDDDTSDVLTGSSGSDWFFANVDGAHRDVITDLTATEFADDMDFITAV
jgi:Ca2+-binding RTX toxin-like protein